MSSAICFDLDQSKIVSSGNGLRVKALSEHKVSGLINTENFWPTTNEMKRA